MDHRDTENGVKDKNVTEMDLSGNETELRLLTGEVVDAAFKVH